MKLPRFFGESWQGGTSASHKPTRLVSHHEDYSVGQTTGGLSVLFTVLCIVDLFGVFPVVALPKSIIACGVYGIPLVVTVFALQLYTAVLLGKCWLLAQEISPQIAEKNRYPYAAVAELAFGSWMRSTVTFLIDATVFSAGVPNLIVASQSLQLFSWKITGGDVAVSYCSWMLLIGVLLCPVMWLGSPKDMKPLALTSVFIVSTVAVSTWTCILLDDVSPISAGGLMLYKPNIQDFLIAYGIIAFQFDIHPMLLTIQVDMKDSSRINGAVFTAFTITGFMFAVTTALAASRYGFHVDNNILQGIPPSIPLYAVALLVTVQLCLSSAVGNSALFQHIEDLLHIPRDFSVHRCILRSSIVAIAVFLGESVPRFDLVMGLVGSTLTGPLMFVFPPLFFLRLCYMKKHLIESDPDFPLLKTVTQALGTPVNGYANGVIVANQNGRSKKRVRFSNDVFTKYKTFDKYEVIDSNSNKYGVKWYDMALAATVMSIGVLSTIVATYSSWSDVISSATFAPPCLVNSTAAARAVLDIV